MIPESFDDIPDTPSVQSELIRLSLPAIAGQAIEPLAQLMETAYIGRLGQSYYMFHYVIRVHAILHVLALYNPIEMDTTFCNNTIEYFVKEKLQALDYIKVSIVAL